MSIKNIGYTVDPYGHDIVIWSEPNNKITIKCKWPDKVRSKDGEFMIQGDSIEL
jgi:hypothetical protein